MTWIEWTILLHHPIFVTAVSIHNRLHWSSPKMLLNKSQDQHALRLLLLTYNKHTNCEISKTCCHIYHAEERFQTNSLPICHYWRKLYVIWCSKHACWTTKLIMSMRIKRRWVGIPEKNLPTSDRVVLLSFITEWLILVLFYSNL